MSILAIPCDPDQIWRKELQIWNPLKIALQMIPKPSLLVKVKFSKSTGILQYFAFYGLV
jgi:hypothetical protein